MGFKVGFSKIVITPKIGTPMGGYGARIGNSSGIHDDLFARSVYFNHNGEESLIISADVLSFPLEVVKFYRKLINQKTGIKKPRIFICALHNHSGPDTIGITLPTRGFFRLKFAKQIFIDLGRKIIKVAQQAKKNSREAIIGADKKLMEKRLIINRREPLKDSKYEVGIIQFSDLQGDLIGIIINYACHGTVLPSDNTLFTAEYPGYLVKRITARLGDNVHIVYLNGPNGDINPNLFDFDVDLKELDAKKELLYDGPGHAKGNFKRAREIGFAIADMALEISKKIKNEPVTDFKHTSKSYIFPMKNLIYENSVRMYLKHILYKLKLSILWGLWRLNKTEIPYPIDFIKKDGKYFQEAEIHAIKINDIVIVGIPGEVFSELGARVLKKSSVPKTFIVELANGYLGYLFPFQDFRKGGYEMFLSVNPAEGTYLTNKAINLVNAL
ncbi:MAG: neutral/alkaline non-lysosomal ceramidase N-terminal domain-containing protein [Candidatus Helarchaeota archaeon]|nr:neutral/alkaline non-lysosomal ceramidase N-terminal domain-containing protein [Candidatus Helarchaeota archaeon]